MEPVKNQEDGLYQNYLNLKDILEAGLSNAGLASDLREAKGFLIEVQNHFKGFQLRREDREELYNRLQDAFVQVNKQIEAERLEYELTALTNFAELKPDVAEACKIAENSLNSKETWDLLIGAQNRVRGAKLFREQREELHGMLEEAFMLLKIRREEDQHIFEQESAQNYIRLKSLVEKGLLQAEETHEYKETREFLKKIQSEFKGVKLVREQREELYSRLQTAFDILGKRLDEYFRHKKKNWEVKMQFTLSRLSADIYELQEALHKELSYLNELEDHLEIITSSGKDKDVLTGLQARLTSTRLSIERKHRQIHDLEIEKMELQTRLDEPESKE